MGLPARGNARWPARWRILLLASRLHSFLALLPLDGGHSPGNGFIANSSAGGGLHWSLLPPRWLSGRYGDPYLVTRILFAPVLVVP